MSKAIQAVRGMNDVLPDGIAVWQFIERQVLATINAYGYREIRFPLVEKTELYARSIGEVTDIVEKEMYTFEDRNGERLSLRPEGTAGCVRAGIENGLFHNQIQRLYYIGPMFRHERPQKGRYRQFHQIGVEAYGLAGPDIDAEIIAMSARIWRALGLSGLQLEINSLGTPLARQQYRGALVAYLSAHSNALDDDSRRRLQANPLRVLDSKNPALAEVLAGAPRLLDYLDAESRAHFDGLQARLAAAGIDFKINPRLVRGLDYYTRTVFEWVAAGLGAQATVCAGGRYDGLVEQLGGRATPAVGFAIGLERLVELVGPQCLTDLSGFPHVYFAVLGEAAQAQAFQLAEQVRDYGLRVQLHCGGGELKNQMKRADRSGARFAAILGDEEVQAGQVAVKDLRADEPQEKVKFDELGAHLQSLLDR